MEIISQDVKSSSQGGVISNNDQKVPIDSLQSWKNQRDKFENQLKEYIMQGIAMPNLEDYNEENFN